jgi:hypothetical protein
MQIAGGHSSRPRHNGLVPRFWIYMQVVVLVCVIASMVIAVIKL